ncbi:hypothetical protein MKW98_029492 [Papaver atlanticum]|uniref:Uncharacterized protein n=1 Tax=Papaver atlanticum TaxID=357466 RepID=A0AAD4XEX9_9MAGN|nr:hypothetical protein MKW98_029492 [Papaver atlanticum]
MFTLIWGCEEKTNPKTTSKPNHSTHVADLYSRSSSSLKEPSSVEKITEIDEHIDCGKSTGLTVDDRTHGEHARVETQGAQCEKGASSNNEKQLSNIKSLVG